MDILVYKDGRFVCTENPLKAGSLDGLAMLVTNPQDGDVLKYDAASGTWLNGTGSDFAPTITSPQNGQVIKYNGTAWVNGTGGGDFSPDISNPQDGQVLVYDGTAGKWVNGAASGGGMAIPTVQEDSGVYTWSHTFSEILALINAGRCVCIRRNGRTDTIWNLHTLSETEIAFEFTEVTPSGVTSSIMYYADDNSTEEENTMYPNPD